MRVNVAKLVGDVPRKHVQPKCIQFQIIYKWMSQTYNITTMKRQSKLCVKFSGLPQKEKQSKILRFVVLSGKKNNNIGLLQSALCADDKKNPHWRKISNTENCLTLATAIVILYRNFHCRGG
ncbi:hypothetical protein ACI65C_011331 [Semiaphis heraclei]